MCGLIRLHPMDSSILTKANLHKGLVAVKTLCLLTGPVCKLLSIGNAMLEHSKWAHLFHTHCPLVRLIGYG